MKTLYICYFGLREPLVQTQVLPYLQQIAAAGIDVTLLTFEPRRWPRAERKQATDELTVRKICWLSLAYHKRPSLPATLYDIARGAVVSWLLVRREGIDVLHARSHVPATIAALVKRVARCRMVFDVRGFFPEEYVDAGVWPEGGLLHRLTKAVEKRLFASADACVVLTQRAREVLRSGEKVRGVSPATPIEVIPCCVDLSRFEAAEEMREQTRDDLGATTRQVIVYAGALGGWYLSEEMADFLAVARAHRSTFSLILTQSPAARIAELLAERGIPSADLSVRKVEPGEVPRFLAASDLAFCFIKPAFSKLSSSPTKIAEYLAAGLPVICNSGIGDVDEVLTSDRVGVLVGGFTQEAYLAALHQAERLCAEPDISERCRASARKRFDLEDIGGRRYISLYRVLSADATRSAIRPDV